MIVHGCSPSDAWAQLRAVSPDLHPIGEQPPSNDHGLAIQGACAQLVVPCREIGLFTRR